MSNQKRRSEVRDGAEPRAAALLFLTLHELAATCAIGAVVFAVLALTQGGSLYWGLGALCIVGVPVCVRLARRSTR
ncbi:MAG: hypothetical protein U1F36_14120 [Planctomycetota bacterium]